MNDESRAIRQMDIIDKLFGSRDAQPLHDDGMEPLSSTYRCVEIKPNSAAPCSSVQALKGRRFFPDEIPELPLPGCTAENCRCGYELFEDRRRNPRHSERSERSSVVVPGRDEH